ncbi:general substrate transporter [Cryphonectria parasitica EP155]|uniref:General substrate transporter n=1 Tax=Cryphonectria parasitica (strain ATCC 38755 / EP155) TaxID=660469 RepID=A0A9P4Y3A1_CRYP1|nr:general substrate transporter [Cryphonectria parasitica EP155]KAF3765883.1 general substrate transporter [Cryphonectria parasitica EP155]
MDSLQAPLISNRDPDDRDDNLDDVLDSGISAADGSSQAEKSSPSLFVWLLTFSAGISGLLFGYDTGVISATLVSLDRSLSNRVLTSFDKTIITAATALFALLITPFSSHLADRLGRKRVILFADLLFIVGALLQAVSSSIFVMTLGRSIVGAAVGAASFVTPLYIAELAPAAHRGRLVTMNNLFVTLGQVIAYVVGWAFAEHGSRATGWRWMVGLGALPAILQNILVLFMPESPRWLVRAGRVDEARQVIKRVAGGNTQGASAAADVVLKDIKAEILEEEQAQKARRVSPQTRNAWLDGWDEVFAVQRNRRALAIACLLQGLQQLCGFNSLMYFSATIFLMLGFTSPTLTSMTVALTNFLFTVAAVVMIDRVGRRRILLYSVPFMVVGLLLSAYGFSLMKLSTSTSDVGSAPPPPPPPGRGAAVVVLFSIMLYVAAYAIGLGSVPWMQSELFSLSARSIGSGAATGTNWASNFVVGLTFLPLMDALSPSWTFVLYAVVCVIGLWLVYLIYPETSGLTLEEAASLLERDDWGVGSH